MIEGFVVWSAMIVNMYRERETAISEVEGESESERFGIDFG